MARRQHHHFAKTVLTQAFFGDPSGTFAQLKSANAEAFLVKGWHEAGQRAGGVAIQHVDHHALTLGGPVELHMLQARGVSQAGAFEIVFVTMPAALQPNEALYVALVTDGSSHRVYFYERCGAESGSGTHASEAVLAMVSPGGRANLGWFQGLSFEAFVAALSQAFKQPIAVPPKPSEFIQPTAPATAGPASPVGASPDQRGALFPLLKAKDWPHKSLALTMPLPGIPHPDAPCVSFARNMANQYVILTKADAGSRNPQEVFDEAVRNLSAQPVDLVVVQGVAVCAGSDFAADRLVDPNFMAMVHLRLGTHELFVCAPHRKAIFLMSADAPAKTQEVFMAMIVTENRRDPQPGAPVSNLMFHVVRGQLRSASGAVQAAVQRTQGMPLPASASDYGHRPAGGGAHTDAPGRPIARIAAFAMVAAMCALGIGNLVAGGMLSILGMLVMRGATFALLWVPRARPFAALALAVPMLAWLVFGREAGEVIPAVAESFAWGATAFALAIVSAAPKPALVAAVGIALLSVGWGFFPGASAMAFWWLRLAACGALAAFLALQEPILREP